MEHQVKEEQLVEAILLAISENFNEVNFEDSSFGDTKITKIVYDVSNNLNLPITRSWYKFGTYVWAPNCRKSVLEQFFQKKIGQTEIKGIIEYPKKAVDVSYSDILNEVEKHDLIHNKPLNDFLNELYSTWAPKGTRNLYKSHKKFIDRVHHICIDLPNDLYPVPQYLLASGELTELHREIIKFSDDIISDIVIDYTSHIEEIIMKIDSSLDDGVNLSKICDYLQQVYTKYLDEIWTLPASQIAATTLEGPKADVKKIEFNDIVKNACTKINIINDVRKITISNGHFPTTKEIINCQNRIKNNLLNEKSLINDLYLSYIR